MTKEVLQFVEDMASGEPERVERGLEQMIMNGATSQIFSALVTLDRAVTREEIRRITAGFISVSDENELLQNLELQGKIRINKDGSVEGTDPLIMEHVRTSPTCEELRWRAEKLLLGRE
jgi:hypothetical protein